MKTLLAVFVIVLLMPIAQARAVEFSFNGSYIITSGSLQLGAGDITIPGIATVEFSTALTLDPNSASTIGPFTIFDFAPTFYDDAVTVKDDNGIVLFTADLTVETLTTIGSSGGINSAFEINLTGIQAGSTYISGSSVIIDAFVAASKGSMSFTLQLPGKNLANAIINGSQIDATYSGTAAAAVPEPTSFLLLGAGLTGLALYRRMKR